MLLIAEKNIILIIFLILSLSELVKAPVYLHHSNTTRQKHGMLQSVTNAGKSQ